MPFTHIVFAKEAVDGMPLIRAMFLDYPSAYTHGTATQYQYMYGTDFLVAPFIRKPRLMRKAMISATVFICPPAPGLIISVART